MFEKGGGLAFPALTAYSTCEIRINQEFYNGKEQSG